MFNLDKIFLPISIESNEFEKHKPIKKILFWTTEDLNILLREEYKAKLSGHRLKNFEKYLQNFLPHRTIRSIKTKRSTTEYKNQLENCFRENDTLNTPKN